MRKLSFSGVFTALVTPFHDDGSLDEASFTAHVERQIAAGIAGLVPCGTTGESVTLSEEEREQVIALAVKAARGRLPVIAGTGSNDTARTVRATRRARELGADAALVVTPYYNKPTPAGLERHYKTVADQGGLPVVVYNVPGRTGTNIPPEVLARFWGHPGIAAVKEAAGNVEQTMTLVRDRPEGFAVLSGDDSLFFSQLALGIDGAISVVSNEVPLEMATMARAAKAGEWRQAREIHYRYLELMRANFLESNPIPVKTALALMGLEPPVKESFRLPLCPATDGTRERLRAILGGLELLPKGGRG